MKDSLRKASLNLPADLHEAGLAQAYYRRYPSFNAYIVALLRLDSIHLDKNDHDLAKRIAALPADNRNAIDREIMQNMCEPSWAAAAERRSA